MELSGLKIVLIVNHQITELVWAFMRSLDFSSYWIAMGGSNKVSPVEFDTLVEMTQIYGDGYSVDSYDCFIRNVGEVICCQECSQSICRCHNCWTCWIC